MSLWQGSRVAAARARRLEALPARTWVDVVLALPRSTADEVRRRRKIVLPGEASKICTSLNTTNHLRFYSKFVAAL